MGFGLLFVGYFVANLMSFNNFGAIFELLGYGIMCYATMKLSQYNKKFYTLFGATACMIVISAINSVIDVSVFLEDSLIISQPLIPTFITDIISYVELAGEFAIAVTLFMSVRAIAKETEVGNIQYAAFRNFIITCVFFVMQIVMGLPIDSVKGFANEIALLIWTLILYLACAILNLVMIFSCYSKICDSNDVDMTQKPSRFAFVNKMREEMEEKRNRAIKSTEKYVEDKKTEQHKKKKKKKK